MVIRTLALTPRQTDGDETVTDVCGDDPTWICREVWEATGNSALSQIADWVIGRPLKIAFILFIGWVAARIARHYVRKWVKRIAESEGSTTRRSLEVIGLEGIESLQADEPDPRREARAVSISAVLGSTVSVIIWSIAIMIALSEAGINLAPLIAGAGIAGVALGFGAQSLVKDCIAGFFMLVEDQYGIGDHVDLGEATGTVERITLRVSVLRSGDGTVWHVPNGEVRRVGNRSQVWSIAVIDMDVAYDADLARVREVMRTVAAEVCATPEFSEVILDEPEMLGVEVLGPDAITVRMHIKTSPGAQWRLQRALREQIKIAFDAENIEIPFPQRTVWVRSEA
ncbi:MAG: mechanosensitive ion channel family protein [Acidimicrobiia bacterium]|nr:mechanosensitive ion channel family protein [Acidimicrobiia bacterium]